MLWNSGGRLGVSSPADTNLEQTNADARELDRWRPSHLRLTQRSPNRRHLLGKASVYDISESQVAYRRSRPSPSRLLHVYF